MIVMFTLFMLMLKDDLFCLLKSWFFFLLCSLFSSKNTYFFFFFGGGWGGGPDGGGVFCIFDVPREEGFNDFRWNLIRGGVQENTVFKGTSRMYGPFVYFSSY